MSARSTKILIFLLTIVQIGAQQQNDGICRDIKKQPIGLFPFHRDTAGKNIYGDSSTNAIVKGITYTKDIDGTSGKAAYLKGDSSSYFEIPRHTILDTGKDISISLNIFPQGNEGEIFSYKTNGGGVQIFQRKQNSTSTSTIYIRFPKRSLSLVEELSEKCLEHDKWNLITTTYNYEKGEACLYKNGTLLKKVIIGSHYIATQFPIRVGALDNDNPPFHGRVSCLQIYNYTLGLEEVKQTQYTCRNIKNIIPVPVVHVDSIKYPEPGNPIKFIVNEPLSDIYIIINFGDGSPILRTRERIITHQYSVKGVYTFEMKTYLGCESNIIETKKQITIYKYVEKPEGLDARVEGKLFGANTTFKATVASGTDFNCTWSFGDDSQKVTTIYTGGKEQNIQHQYAKSGIYNGNVACYNRKATLQQTFKADIQEVIKGLEINEIGPQLVNRGFEVSWKVKEGSAFKYKVIVNDKELLFTQDGMTGKVHISAELFNGNHGVYKIKVEVNNKVTPTLTKEASIFIHPVVKPVTITVPKYTIEVNESITFLAVSESPHFQGFPKYEWEFGDGSKVNSGSENHTSHMYIMYGKALVKLTTYNPLSSHISMVEITILRPVLQLKNLRCSAPPSSTKSNVSLQCKLVLGSDFTCTVDWDGLEMRRHDFTNKKYYLNQSISKLGMKDLQFTDIFSFDAPKHYIISVSCTNRISRADTQSEIIVQEKLIVKVAELKPQVFGTSFRMMWKLEKGTEAIYKIFWNGKEISGIEYIGGTPSVEITREIYKNPGSHTFKVESSNSISNSSQTIKIIIETEITDVEFAFATKHQFIEVDENVTFNFKTRDGSNPNYRLTFGGDDKSQIVTKQNILKWAFSEYGKLEFKLEAFNNVSSVSTTKILTILKPVLPLKHMEITAPNQNISEPATIIVKMDQGSDYMCHIQFGDETEHNTNLLYSSYYTTTGNKNVSKYSNIQMLFTHPYNQVKNHTIKVTCSNRMSKASAIANIAIFKPVAPFSIVVPETNELNTPLTIRMSQENDILLTKHTFLINFGDGKKMVTKSNEVVHSFGKFGTYKISIVIENPVSRFKVNKRIIILKPVVALKGLSVFPPEPVNLTEPTMLSIKLEKGSDFNCSIEWLPNHVTKINKMNIVYYDHLDMKEFQNLQFNAEHTFEKEGHYSVEVTCYNRLGRVATDITVTTQIALDGFYLKPTPPQIFGQDFYIHFDIQKGSDLTLDFVFNGQKIEVSSKERHILITGAKYTKPGIYDFTLTGSNLVSSKLTRNGVVVIEKEIKNVSVMLQGQNNIEVNKTVSFTVEIIGGSSVLFLVDFGDGTKLKDSTSLTYSHKYSLYGSFKVTVKAYNNVSKVHASSLEIIVEKPVLPLLGMTIKANKNMNISKPYSFTLTLDQGSDFECTIDYGNNFEDKIPKQRQAYYTTNPRWSVKGYTEISILQTHVFSKIGTCLVKAMCLNRLYKAEAEISINVFVPLSEFSISAAKTEVEINDTVSLRINGVDKKADPTFRINGGRYTPAIVTKSFDFKMAFSHHGAFNVSVNASNPTSSVEGAVEVVVLKPVLTLRGLQSFVQPTNLTTAATLKLTLDKGSDFKCTINWGDGKTTDKSFSQVYSFYSDLSLDEIPFTNIQHEFKHTYESIGEYNIRSTCSNRKNELVVETKVNVQVPIIGFELESVGPQRLGMTFKVNWKTIEGSNINFNITWNKQLLTYKNSPQGNNWFATIVPDLYGEANIYRYTVSAKNLVSDAGHLSGYVIIEEPMKGISVRLSKSQDVEVNETVKALVLLESGSYPHFRYETSKSGKIIANSQAATLGVFYTKQGRYTIKVYAWNNVSRIEAEATVNVIKPVLPVTKIRISIPEAYEALTVAKIKIIVESGSDYKCFILYGDGSQEITETINNHYYINGRQESMEDFQDFEHVFQHNYTVGNAYRVQVTCSNRISSKTESTKVMVQSKIEDLKILEVSPKRTGEEFEVSFHATRGTNITYFVYFKDKVVRHHSDGTDLKKQKTSFDQPGIYKILINATNHISGVLVKSVSVLIEDPISNLQIFSPLSDTELNVKDTFEFCYGIDKGSSPRFRLIFGGKTLKKNSKLKIQDGKPQFCFQHTFDSYNNFIFVGGNAEIELKVIALNNVTTLMKSVMVTLLKPVIEIEMKELKCLPAVTNLESKLSLSISGSDMKCTWLLEGRDDITTKVSNIYLKSNTNKDQSAFQNLLKSHSNVYDKAGVYKATVKCQNRKSSDLLSTFCYVQDAISGFKIDSINPMLLFGTSNEISWTVESGTNITYVVKLKKRILRDVQTDGKRMSVVFPKDIVSIPGEYSGVIEASNLVTKDLPTPFWIRFEKELKVEDVRVTYEHEISGSDQEGHSDGSYFPTRRSIKFDIEMNTGEFDIEWSVVFEGKKETSSKQKAFKHKFETPGSRMIKYHVSNNVSSSEGQVNLTFIDKVGSIALTSNSPKWIGFGMNFTIQMPEKGQETCFKFEPGDGEVYYYTTEKGNCKIFYANVSKIDGIFPKNQASFLVTHWYKTGNLFYNAKVIAINYLSKKEASVRVLVSEVICNFPNVKIKNLGNSTFYPARIMKSEKMTAYTDTLLDCKYTSKVKYQWEIYKYNTENGILEPVKFENKSDYGFNPYTQKDLVVKKKTLSYGIYLMKVTVTMDEPKTFVFMSVAKGYLHVYPSPLVAAIKDGMLIRRGIGKPITVNGGDSCDPDINKNNFTGMTFAWYCFNAMESLPTTFTERYSNIPSYEVSILNPLPFDGNVVKKGGCYGNGTYVFTTKDKNFKVDTVKMVPDQTYVIFVIVSKGKRTSLGYQAIELVKGLPPILAIECVENCLQKINPSGKFALMGKCTGEVCNKPDMQYQWSVYTTANNITVDGKTLWELDQHVMKEVDQYRNQLVFVIKKFTLTSNKLYRFTLTGGLVDGEKGLTQRSGFTNAAPSGGRCFSNLEQGEALETEFTFECEGWDDPDQPLSYEFVYYNDQGGESLFTFGPSTKALGKLPLGLESNNFTIKVDVRIIDVYEATSIATFNVTVVEPKLSEDEMIAKLLNMTQGENSELEIIINSGDTQAIANLLNAVSSILNKKGENAGERKKARSQMLAAISQNGTLQVNGSVIFHNGTVLHSNETAVLRNGTVIQKNGTVLHPNGTMFYNNGTWVFGNHTGFNITELTAEEQRKRDRETIRAAMIKALSNQKATSLEAMRQNADVMGSLTKLKDEVNAQAQEASASSMLGMASQLSGESSSEDGESSDSIESAAGSMAAGLGNLLGSAAGSAKPKVVKRPTTTTPPSTTISVLKFEGMFEDDDEDIQVSQDDDDYVEMDPAKLKAQETVAGVFSAAGSVGGSMTKKKLPGEESTLIDSPSLAMLSGQVDPEKMGAPVCSPSGAGFKMPSTGKLLKNPESTKEGSAVGQQMMELKDNPFTWDPKGGVSGTVTSVTLNSAGGPGLVVDNSEEPIEITMPREGVHDPPTLVSFPPDTQKYVYHKVEIENYTAFTAHIVPQNISGPPFNGSVMLGVYVRRDLRPTLQKHDWSFIFPRSNVTYDACSPAPPEANYTLFISDKYLSKGVYWIGVSYLAPPGMPEDALVNSTLNYTIRIFTSQCKYWNEGKNKWMTDGCHVGPKTDLSKTHCLCTHLTSFGGGMLTAPAPIDFSKVFAGFKNMFASGNVGVFFTIIGMFCLYILLAVYSRRQDKKEEAQMGVTPIFNVNHPDASYQYEVTFYTNRGSASGTSAQIFVNIVGENGESGAVPLKDTERKVFLAGAINSFLIMVPSSLGEIKHIRLWHDNSGYTPSWNLQKLEMRDLQSNDTWVFLGGWWAVDEGDFQIDKSIKPATEADLADFKVLFQEKLMKDLGDAHIWFSIFLRPPTSRFTRLQRLSCCLTILCLTMVSSAMFYGAGPASAEDDANALAIGPIKISIRMIIISIQSSLVVVPPSLLIVYLFASAKRRNAITIEGSLKKAKERKQREENAEEEEEEVSLCCCFKRKRKRKPKNAARKTCFRCCRRGADSEDEFNDFHNIGEEVNECFEEDEEYLKKTTKKDKEKKIRIAGYYSSDEGASSDETYVSSSDEIATNSESEEMEVEEEPILDNDEILAIEIDSSKALQKEEEKKDNIVKKLIKKITKKKELTPEQQLEKEKKDVEALEKQIHGSLPWWVIYPAWVLVFFGSTGPALFTLFYSMMWGKTKSNDWLTTQALSFFQDTFVSRPLKIIVITTIVAILLKNKRKSKSSQPAEPLQEGETLVTSGLENESKDIITEMCKPPNPKAVAYIRKQKLREKKISQLLIELAYFVFYILLLFLVSASNRDIWAYKQRKTLDQLLVHGGGPNSPMMKIDDVNSVDGFWKYVNKTFIPSMYYESWYNGDVFNYTAYAMLRETKRLGITRLRQHRAKHDTCTIHPYFRKYIKHCNDKYSSKNEDHQWYKKGWTDPTERKGKQKKRFSPWKYASGSESRNIIPVMAARHTYMGGGYLGELGINEEYSLMYERYMKKYNWIDKDTRGVFLEFTLYNPNLNLISVGMIMFEFFNFGGVLPRAEIYVSRMYRNLVPEHKIFLAFDIVFFVYTLYCFFRECKKMKQQRKNYFKSMENITNLILVVLGFAVMATYTVRSISLGSKIEDYINSPNLFISFYQNAMYHELVAVLMSIIDFIAIIKFLTFLQFNRMFLVLIQTIVRAAPKLLLFCIYLSILVFSFVIFAYLLLGSERYNFSSIKRTMYSLNLLLLGVFDWDDFMSRPSVGPYFFMMYCTTMTFILMNIFMTILMEVYAYVQLDEKLREREFHLMKYLMESFMISMGIKKPLGLQDFEEEVNFRKKDPFVHRLNRIQRSIEERKTPKINKLINKVYADEVIEDIEMISLELMCYPAEFFKLIPCSIKVKLQALLQRGDIDHKTYRKFLEMSQSEDNISVCSKSSLDSQRTMLSLDEIATEEAGSNLTHSMLLREENEAPTIPSSPIEALPYDDEYPDFVPVNEKLSAINRTEEECLKGFYGQSFSPRQCPTIEEETNSCTSLTLDVDSNSNAHLIVNADDTRPKRQMRKLPEPHYQQETIQSGYVYSDAMQKQPMVPYSEQISARDSHFHERYNLPFDQNKNYYFEELRQSDQAVAVQEESSPQTSISSNAGDNDSSRDLLKESSTNTGTVVSARRKKKKPKNSSNV